MHSSVDAKDWAWMMLPCIDVREGVVDVVDALSRRCKDRVRIILPLFRERRRGYALRRCKDRALIILPLCRCESVGNE